MPTTFIVKHGAIIAGEEQVQEELEEQERVKQ